MLIIKTNLNLILDKFYKAIELFKLQTKKLCKTFYYSSPSV
jgi:hypothetical protein